MTKRILTCLICTLLACTMLAMPVSALVGDLNGDEQRTAIDYFALKRYVLGTHILSESALENADLDLDGKVNAKDYMILKRVILGTYALSEPEEEIPADTLTAIIKLSLTLQNSEGKDVATLESTLPIDSNVLNGLLADFFASHPEYAEGDLSALDEQALQELSELIADAILDSLLHQ